MWRFFERWGAQGVTFIVSIVLARSLGPEVFGTLALVTIFTTIMQVFIDSGLGTALIQKKDADDIDFSTVFWFNILMCVIIYVLMFFAAPFIANFYSMPELTPVIRVLSITLIISGIKGVQQSYVSRNMLFKRFFFSTLGGTIGAAIVGILMAYLGFGVWALVAQYIFNNLVDTIILWTTVKWRPKFVFSLEKFRGLFGYGWRMLVSTLIDTLYNNMRSLIIGKFYSSGDLAYYTKGKQFPDTMVSNINASMNSILLPVLSSKQDHIDEIKDATRRVIKISSYVIWPMMIGLCVVAKNLILVLLTEKWIPAVVYLQILCFDQVLQPLQTTNLSVIKALGHAEYHLKLEIFKKSIALILIVTASLISVKAIAISSVAYAVIASIINSYPNRKLINYSYFSQIKDIVPCALCSMFMGIFVYLVGLISINPLLMLIIQVFVGTGSYILLSIVFRIDSFNYILQVIKGLKKR